MKAMLLTRTGDPSVLDYVEVPTPRPRDAEVLVKADTIGVSRPEIMVRKGSYPWMPKLPTIPGIEMTGTVVERGRDVTELAVGVKGDRGRRRLVALNDVPRTHGIAEVLPATCDDCLRCKASRKRAFPTVGEMM
jgi:NADPH:quinone reductase-like Zn-dependent oxidoreductase